MNWKALIAGFLLGGCIAAVAQQWRLARSNGGSRADLTGADGPCKCEDPS
jgi:hypothetical protein